MQRAWKHYCGAATLVFLSATGASAAPPTSALCRVVNQHAGVADIGSGTLVDVSDDGRCGLILTCAHLFREGTGQVHVEFADGRTHGAAVVAVDHEADLGALEILDPRRSPATVSYQLDRQGVFSACGFGGAGALRCITGTYAGDAESMGRKSVKTTGAVRSGDSGGGLFDARGRLVGVVWGQEGGTTYSSTGGPLQRFLTRVLGRRLTRTAPRVAAAPPGFCPNGQCPLTPPRFAPRNPPSCDVAGGLPSTETPPPAPLESPVIVAPQPHQPALPDCGCDDRWAALAAQLSQLSQSPKRPDHAATGIARLARAPHIVLPFVLATTLLGGWFLHRRARSRRSSSPEVAAEAAASTRSSSSSPTEATAAADAMFQSADSVDVRQPIERDDREARQLLRLSQLEGRDPLQDALAGRLALDRLDEIADSDVDAPQRGWADELRRELRERFNDVAPTRFSPTGAV